MGYYVHIHVVFACDNNEGVAQLAKKHIAEADDLEPHAEWFLHDLSERHGNNPGRKGGLSLWGGVGNHVDSDRFIETLKPFWTELLHEVPGGPLDHEHIMVFIEAEGTEHTTAYEIFLARDDLGDASEPFGELVIKKHKCPFAFMQE